MCVLHLWHHPQAVILFTSLLHLCQYLWHCLQIHHQTLPLPPGHEPETPGFNTQSIWSNIAHLKHATMNHQQTTTTTAVNNQAQQTSKNK
jgi:hypothetical protein